jgi:hypothetical protein
MAVRRNQANSRAFAEVSMGERLSNQVTFSGTNDSLSIPKGFFLLDYLEIETGKTVEIKDGKGTSVVTGVTQFNQEFLPLRLDYGFEIVGDVQFGKGSAHDGVFAS